MEIALPISKSIANRWLMLQAMHGDKLLSVDESMPDDVRLLHGALQVLQGREGGERMTIDVQNCGTAMRFLTAYCAQLPDSDVILTGIERMKQRPIGQLVEALRAIRADVTYMEKEGFPPLHIRGKVLEIPTLPVVMQQPQSSQFVSALLLIGVPVATDSRSPYIYMTRQLIEEFADRQSSSMSDVPFAIEADWSAAAFWYEYVALYGGEVTLRGLHTDSLQGDKTVMSVFEPLGVVTACYPYGIHLSRRANYTLPRTMDVDFTMTPDLYPAVALTCEHLGVSLHATGTDCLRWKESDRLAAVASHCTCADHRMAMALMVAGYEVDDVECIAKSYPQFINQLCKLRS